jgi:hypothetical protein
MTTPDPTSTAVAREAAWLAISNDTLPDLSAAGWEVIQAYWPGARWASQKPGIYVTRRMTNDDHPNAQRYRPQYTFTLKLHWPVRNPTPPIAETEQQAFDTAIGYLLMRIRGLPEDKTHGGRFLTVAEVPGTTGASVDYEDPALTIAADKELRATVSYRADEIEFYG